MPSIAILGSNGMLGQMARFYFSQYYEVTSFDLRYSLANRKIFFWSQEYRCRHNNKLHRCN